MEPWRTGGEQQVYAIARILERVVEDSPSEFKPRLRCVHGRIALTMGRHQ